MFLQKEYLRIWYLYIFFTRVILIGIRVINKILVKILK